VVVTRNPGPWFEATVASLGDQDYTELTVLVVDCGSDEDPTPRVAEVLPGRSSDGSAPAPGSRTRQRGAEHGRGRHLPPPLPRRRGARPPVVRVLVEEAYRSNAGILGPKLVSADNPEILLEVGRAIDRFGAPYTGIEPGEVDQEQHDGVRDVFYVTTGDDARAPPICSRSSKASIPRRSPARRPRPVLARPPRRRARARRARRRVAHREAAGERTAR